MGHSCDTIQDDLLVRVIFGKFIAIDGFYIGDLNYHVFFLLDFFCLELWLYGHVHIVINFGKFSEKSPIANKLSCMVIAAACQLSVCNATSN